MGNTRTVSIRPDWVLFYAMVSFAAVGCGSREPRLEVHPVQGSVSVAGKAQSGVRLVFHAKVPSSTDAVFPRAVTDESGSFVLATYETNDGIPAGAYVVTASWKQLDTTDPSEMHPDELSSAPERLAKRFTTPETSPIQVVVEPGNNQLSPFDLEMAKLEPRRRK